MHCHLIFIRGLGSQSYFSPDFIANKTEAQRNETTRTHSFKTFGRTKALTEGHSNCEACAPSFAHTPEERRTSENKGRGTNLYVLWVATSGIMLRLFVNTTSFSPYNKFVFKTRFLLKHIFLQTRVQALLE